MWQKDEPCPSDVTIVTAQAQGWELTSIPQGEMVNALAEDGFPAAVVAHGLRTYCNVAGGGGGEGGDGGGGGGGGVSKGGSTTLWCVDAARVCTAKASQLLDSAPGAGRGGVAVGGGGGGGAGGGATRWRLNDFTNKWRGLLPEELRNACHDTLLRGLALVEKAADGSDGVVRPFRAEQLSKVPKERFNALFALKPRWTMEELEPYMAAVPGMTVETQLLKFTRVSQPTAASTPVYSKR